MDQRFCATTDHPATLQPGMHLLHTRAPQSRAPCCTGCVHPLYGPLDFCFLILCNGMSPFLLTGEPSHSWRKWLGLDPRALYVLNKATAPIEKILSPNFHLISVNHSYLSACYFRAISDSLQPVFKFHETPNSPVVLLVVLLCINRHLLRLALFLFKACCWCCNISLVSIVGIICL